MSFALFILYLCLTFVRPAEQFPALRDWELTAISTGLALAAAALAVLTGRGPSFRARQIPLVLALLTWAALSVVASPLRSADAFESLLGLVKSGGAAFLLVILNVTTARRLRVVAVTLAVSAVFLAEKAVVAYRQLNERSQALSGDLQALESDGEWEERQPQTMNQRVDPDIRIRSRSLFGDPNDLAATLIAILPFAFALRRTRAPLRNLLLVWIPVGLVGYGIYVTRSRGGVVALACTLGLLVRRRIGTALSSLVAAGMLAGLLTLGFVGGRTMSVDKSASGRIEAWSAGLQMVKSSPVWGVGYDMFENYHIRTAHSAFVQCFAELGLVGYMLWLGLIMVTLDEMRSILEYESEEATELRPWANAVLVGLLGLLVGGLFLSRAYDLVLFVLLGLGASVADLARREGYPVRSRSLLVRIWVVPGVAVTSIVLYWLYMRLLVR